MYRSELTADIPLHKKCTKWECLLARMGVPSWRHHESKWAHNIYLHPLVCISCLQLNWILSVKSPAWRVECRCNQNWLSKITCVSAWHVLGHFIFVNVGDLAKVLGGQLAQVLVGNTSGSGQDHSVALVVGLDVVQQVIPGRTRFKI